MRRLLISRIDIHQPRLPGPSKSSYGGPCSKKLNLGQRNRTEDGTKLGLQFRFPTSSWSRQSCSPAGDHTAVASACACVGVGNESGALRGEETRRGLKGTFH
ncbi:hypothetical protein ElyMa_002385400 [Elysia marginata]|uniref:Uncharacterized protein n=1 Tax=Elysia marginata TaxID=1093978 RepID=A0AAV4GC85_9GAST|nr:hypothetical protein ElyMa_002385400 [Elysia marginata]